jgi:hypothetical protein
MPLRLCLKDGDERVHAESEYRLKELILETGRTDHPQARPKLYSSEDMSR